MYDTRPLLPTPTSVAGVRFLPPFVCVCVCVSVCFSARYPNQYVSGTDLYPHMPILYPLAARYIANVFKFHERRISSVKFTSAHLHGKRLHPRGRGPRAGRFVRFWASV